MGAPKFDRTVQTNRLYHPIRPRIRPFPKSVMHGFHINIPDLGKRRQKEEQALQPVVFREVVRNPLVAQTKVKMIVSVGGKFDNGDRFDLVADQEYWLDALKADEFIIKGYARGKLSKKYTKGEKEAIRSTIQVVRPSSSGGNSSG